MQGTQAGLVAGNDGGGRFFRFLAALLLAGLLAGCDAPDAGDAQTVTTVVESPMALISGTLTYRERLALSPAAVATVELRDVSGGAAAGAIVASVRLESPGNPPIPFRLEYDPARVDEGLPYALRAEIREGERLLFAADQHHAVLTGEAAAEELALLLVRAQEPARETVGHPLDGTRWVLNSIVGHEFPGAGSEEDRRPSLEFSADRVSGYGGCNSFNGGYGAADGTLTIGLLAITQRACPDMSLERTVVQALGEADAYLLDAAAQTLTIVAGGKPSLIYRRAAAEA